MSKTFKKFSAITLTIATVGWLMAGVSFVPVASGQTTAELQAQIASLLAQIQALQAQLASAAAPACTFTATLKIASRSDAVKCLQQYLNGAGYTVATSGAGSSGNETTYFGSKTAAAVKSWQAANTLAADGVFGPASRAKYSALAAVTPPTTTPPTTPPPVSGFALALASDNPAGTTIPKGASGVTLMKFDVSGTGTLSSLVFKRLGIGATTDFSSSGFYLYEGNTRLTSGRSINSTTHEVSFLNLNLVISGKRTLSLVGDVASGATAGNINYFSLVSATGTPTPTGSLVSNSMTIGGQAVGGVVATSSGSVSNPKIGQQNAQLAEFKLTASSTEDISINRIALTEAGTMANENLTGFVLKQNDVSIATASAIGDKDLVSFNLSTPFVLEKGQERVFKLYGNISGKSRSGDTIIFYFDTASDINATGKLYGYPVTPDIVGLDTSGEGQTLTAAGGDVTIAFNGPITGDLALRAQDAEVYNFTISSINNVEIRNLRFSATTAGLASGDGFPDMKVWDTSSNAVITSATDITTTTNVTYTDIISLNANQSRTFKVTVDVDTDNEDSDSILVSLLAFQANDIKNLDNNQYVATTSIVPSATIAGNTMSTRVPTMDVQLAATPSSQTIVRGTSNASLVGFSFRAIASDIKLNSVRVTASSTSGTLTSGEVQSLGLYDGSTLISSLKSLDSTNLNATFDNLNQTIAKGSTKILTVKGNIASDMTNGDTFVVKLNSTTTADLTATDTSGNSATITGSTANTGSTVVVSVTTSGDVSVALAPDDSESEAGIVIAGTESVLGKFRFTATNETMTINKMELLVVPTNSATATSSAAADEAPTIKLYEGSTLVGSSSGYPVTASGDNSGIVYVTSLGWQIPKDSSKTLIVKGALSSVANGADSGASVYASIRAANFEAQGATALDTTLTAATSNQKVVYKTKPTLTGLTAASAKLTVGQIPTLKFKVQANSAEQVSWKQIQFKVAMTGATLSAVDAVPGQTGNVYLKVVGASSNLNLASAFSSTSTTTGQSAAITGSQTGYVSLLLNSEETISAGLEKEYELGLTFADVSGTVGAASVVINLYRSETVLVNATTVTAVRSSLGTATDAAPSFVWSDYSNVSHSESTTDWANGVYVQTLPSSSITISN